MAPETRALKRLEVIKAKHKKHYCEKLKSTGMSDSACERYIKANMPKQNIAYVTRIRGKCYFPCADCPKGKKIIANGVKWKHIWRSGG